MGHLTKFVKPGAVRIDSSANATVKNVAWRNTDGSKALIAYNTSGGTQSVKVNWGGQSFTYSLPTRTSATFTWGGSPSNPPTTNPPAGRTGAITGLGGKCLDVTGGSTTNGNLPQIWDCVAGSANQTWTAGTDNSIRGLGKCLDVTSNGVANGTAVHLWDCIGTVASQKWTATNGTLVNTASGKCLDVKDNLSTNGTKLQIWTCTGAANQRWTAPA
jgi:glucosylceramidase